MVPLLSCPVSLKPQQYVMPQVCDAPAQREIVRRYDATVYDRIYRMVGHHELAVSVSCCYTITYTTRPPTYIGRLQTYITLLQTHMGPMSIHIGPLQTHIGPPSIHITRLQVRIGLMSIHITRLQTDMGSMSIDMGLVQTHSDALQTCSGLLSICMTPMEVDIRPLQPAIRPAEDFPGGPGFDSRRAVSRQERTTAKAAARPPVAEATWTPCRLGDGPVAIATGVPVGLPTGVCRAAA
jgi:hypothetical protein